MEREINGLGSDIGDCMFCLGCQTSIGRRSARQKNKLSAKSSQNEKNFKEEVH